jgi:hypothetical protein
MSFIKLGEATEIKLESADSCIPQVSPEILDNFRKFAANLKRIAPKAEDFLYFSAIMMHAAEAAALHDDGTPRLTASGNPVEVGWDKGGNTWRWMSNDPHVKPYKNSNGDIFPEEELVKAYKKWAGKPLCVDHKSSSVDHVRGFIVDTYYDRNLKRVVALCALDKAGYPQLARQISTGVSNCVSMGTAVGKAVCTDCARVARTEADFCDHMKRKTGYGEINIDLNPLELSIVVNGADPRANIKHIIAAANTLNAYVENKQKELNKFSENFQAALSFGTGNNGNEQGGAVTNININSSDVASFRKDVDKAIADFEKLQSSLNNEENIHEPGNDLASDQLSDTPAADSGLAPPHARYASVEVGVDSIAELREVTKTIESKLSQMKISLDKLAKNTSTINNIHEENMSGTNTKQAYYQGGGGVNEPSPGQAKYQKDPLNEQLREKEDKQMVGQSPFPGVGAVDGAHPSPDSAEPSDELQRKKMLARAEAEERAQRRQAIVNLAKKTIEDKTAYFQGGGGVNEPTPGKQKYPVDKLEYMLREKEDKQMVGQKPFPGVGPVDGMHPSPDSAEPSDELKRKQMLSRANLRARFDRVVNSNGTPNLAKSAWQVYLGDSLILTATVDELSGGRVQELHSNIATKDFGSKLLEKVKAYGADNIRSMLKNAQAAPPPADLAAPAAPPADMGTPPAEDTGKSGDPKQSALDLAEKVRDLSSDLVEAVRALTGEQVEMGEMEGAGEPAAAPEMGSSASFSTATLNGLRKELNSSLIHAMKESVASLNEHAEELDMISGLYDKGTVTNTNQDMVGSILDEALTEARTAVADGFKLMTAFVKYARGTQAIVKRAEIEAELEALAEGETMTGEQDANLGDDLMAMISDTNSDLDDVKSLMQEDEGDHEHDLDGEVADLISGDASMLPADDTNDMKMDVKPGEELPKELPAGTLVEVKASFNSKQGRAALRAKLAADAVGKEEDGEVQDMSHAKFSDMLQEADHLADGQTALDVKPSNNLGLVETLPEVNKAMMDLAKAPPKVRKEAEAIHRLISEGKLDKSDLDALVAEGLDKDAVSYYKKYFAEVDGGSEFASELVKEHVKSQMEEELNKYKVKLARSYELAYDMVARGLCHSDRNAVTAQVEEIMKFNDDSFDSLKRVVAKHELLQKSAGRLPQVGVIGSGESHVVAQADDDWSLLSAAFAKTSKRMF